MIIIWLGMKADSICLIDHLSVVSGVRFDSYENQGYRPAVMCIVAYGHIGRRDRIESAAATARGNRYSLVAPALPVSGIHNLGTSATDG